MDNSESRTVDVFFYGLYMDPDILQSKGVELRQPRIGSVMGYKLRVGKKATLLRGENARTNGIVYQLTHDEIDTLYSKSGLDMYVKEPLMVTLENGVSIPVLCCNLLIPPEAHESNSDYEEKLIQCMVRLGVPANA